jgi:putative transcriptional regulator
METKLKNNVQELRKSTTLTQAELADIIEVTRQTIIAIEKGNYVPSVIIALKLARAFNQPVEAVFTLH